MTPTIQQLNIQSDNGFTEQLSPLSGYVPTPPLGTRCSPPQLNAIFGGDAVGALRDLLRIIEQAAAHSERAGAA